MTAPAGRRRREPIAAAALAELCTSLAHDLRTPLGVVSQVLAELGADFDAQLTAEHRVLSRLAGRGLLRLGRMADKLDLLAALESDDFSLQCGPVDLVALVRDAVAGAVAIEPRREVSVVCELPEGPCRVSLDADRFAAAVSELVINAIRHARGRARVALDVGAGEAHLAIEDDGEGVALERHATLFDRLAGHRSRAGLGIGLSLAHDVVVAHGGSLALEASTLPAGRPGTSGARFAVSLPMEPAR